MQLYSLNKAAQEINISRPSLNRWIKKLSIQPITKGQAFCLTDSHLLRIQKERERIAQEKTYFQKLEPNDELVACMQPTSSLLATPKVSEGSSLEGISKEKNYFEELEFIKKQLTTLQETTSARENILLKRLEESQRSLDQEQHLHANAIQRIKQLENQMHLLEHQSSEKVDDMISLLEKARDSFIQNAKMINKNINIGF